MGWYCRGFGDGDGEGLENKGGDCVMKTKERWIYDEAYDMNKVFSFFEELNENIRYTRHKVVKGLESENEK